METKENRLSIGKVNGVEISAVEIENGVTIVPMRPICEALGVNVGAQIDKAKAHPIYSPTIRLSRMVGADGKDREMICIDLEYVFGWILSIHPDNVSESARESVMKYQRQCHHVLFVHFVGRAQRQQDLIDAERDTISRIHRIDEQLKDIEQSVKNLKSERAAAKESLEKIRTSRLDDQPTLFD